MYRLVFFHLKVTETLNRLKRQQKKINLTLNVSGRVCFWIAFDPGTQIKSKSLETLVYCWISSKQIHKCSINISWNYCCEISKSSCKIPGPDLGHMLILWTNLLIKGFQCSNFPGQGHMILIAKPGMGRQGNRWQWGEVVPQRKSGALQKRNRCWTGQTTNKHLNGLSRKRCLIWIIRDKQELANREVFDRYHPRYIQSMWG